MAEIIDFEAERRRRRRIAQGFNPLMVDMLNDAIDRINAQMRHPAGKLNDGTHSTQGTQADQ